MPKPAKPEKPPGPRTYHFERWKRVEGLGHKEIYVRVDDTGEAVEVEYDGKRGIQCATLDRIPFVMKKRNLDDHYKPAAEVDKAQGPSPYAPGGA